jgi:hypothetical protein
MSRSLVAVVVYGFALFIAVFANPASAQQCPRSGPKGPSVPSQVRVLEGKLDFHNDLRGWFELQLDASVCGQTVVQLVPKPGNATTVASLRGCRVRSAGTMDFSPTGYYSADVFQDVQTIAPAGACLKKPPFPGVPDTKPDARVRTYTVYMHVLYTPGDHPLQVHVRSAGKELRPWQAYASYYLTGEFVLYGHCANGFVVNTVFGTPQAHPMHFEEPRSPDDMATFDPESAAQAGKPDLRFGYICVRGDR